MQRTAQIKPKSLEYNYIPKARKKKYLGLIVN